MIYFCTQTNRRALVLQRAGLNGIDYLEVSDQDGPAGCGTRVVLTLLKDARTTRTCDGSSAASRSSRSRRST